MRPSYTGQKERSEVELLSTKNTLKEHEEQLAVITKENIELKNQLEAEKSSADKYD